MVVKISSKHQVTIPKDIAAIFNLQKGDVLEVEREGNRIVMIPKEVVLKDKYPRKDLKRAEKALSKGMGAEEVNFESGEAMLENFKKRTKK